MADDKSKRAKADRSKVAKMEDYEVKYLAQKHDVTQKAVKKAVDKVGNSRSKVEADLKKDKAKAEDKSKAKTKTKAKATTKPKAKSTTKLKAKAKANAKK